MYGITNFGRSARAIADSAELTGDEILWPKPLPGNPYDDMDTGLIIDADGVRTKTVAELQADAIRLAEPIADRTALKTIYQSDLDALQAIRDFSGTVTLAGIGQAVKTIAVVLIHVLRALKAVV